jgi:hypothetical protein
MPLHNRWLVARYASQRRHSKSAALPERLWQTLRSTKLDSPSISLSSLNQVRHRTFSPARMPKPNEGLLLIR